jgi:hypothetical protein
MDTSKFSKLSLAVVLPLLGAVGCAEPASDEMASDQGAIQIGASVLSGLEAGSYTSASRERVLLRIEDEYQGRLWGELSHLEAYGFHDLRGPIDVSWDGTVTFADANQACSGGSKPTVKLAVSEGHVRVKLQGCSDGFDATFVQRTPKDLEGVYDCAADGGANVGTLELSEATKKSIRADWKDGPLTGTIGAWFTLPATDFESSRERFSLVAPSVVEWWSGRDHSFCKKR